MRLSSNQFIIRSAALLICGMMLLGYLTFNNNIWKTTGSDDEPQNQVGSDRLKKSISQGTETLAKGIQDTSAKKKVLVFISIYSWFTNTQRRIAIRETWGEKCRNSDKAVCWFMMDRYDYQGKPIPETKRQLYMNENETYRDIVIQDSFEGNNWAYRYFTTVIWAYRRYDFEFHLRMDDDSYLCFDRLMYELPFRRNEKYLHWGLEVCTPQQTEIDEGWLLISRDLAEKFVDTFNSTLICHKYTSIAISLMIIKWKNDVVNVTWFGDERVFYVQVPPRAPFVFPNFCDKYLVLHNVYTKKIRKLHETHLKSEQKLSYEIPKVIDLCPRSHDVIDVYKWPGIYFALPKLCKDKPIWSTEKMYKGEGFKLPEKLRV